MSNLFRIKIWKKGSNQYIGLPDYTVEVEDGDARKLTRLLDSFNSYFGDKTEEEMKRNE